MKILWFSNCRLGNENMSGSGTWLATMSEGLLKNGIQLYNITQYDVKEIVEECFENGLHQWVLPIYKLAENGIPGTADIRKIQEIVSSITPDIIQVWGMEAYWGLLTARGYIKCEKIVLEIQGILGSCADVYYGGISQKSLFEHTSLKNIKAITRFSYFIKRKYEKWFELEKEMLAGHRIISTQSEWVRAWIAPYVSPYCKIVKTGIIVRKEFLQDSIWQFNGSHKIFVMMASLIPYKGLHDVLDALKIVKIKYPDATLVVAGNIDVSNNLCSTPEYMAYIRNKIRDNYLSGSVFFVGPKNAKELVGIMEDCSVMVHPSYVESYSLALAESMCLGIPSVVSYAGAMPELASDGVSALFYRPGDYRMCASQIIKILGSKDDSINLSQNAISRARARNDENSVIDLQLGILNSI